MNVRRDSANVLLWFFICTTDFFLPSTSPFFVFALYEKRQDTMSRKPLTVYIFIIIYVLLIYLFWLINCTNENTYHVSYRFYINCVTRNQKTPFCVPVTDKLTPLYPVTKLFNMSDGILQLRYFYSSFVSYYLCITKIYMTFNANLSTFSEAMRLRY